VSTSDQLVDFDPLLTRFPVASIRVQLLRKWEMMCVFKGCIPILTFICNTARFHVTAVKIFDTARFHVTAVKIFDTARFHVTAVKIFDTRVYAKPI
jgi:hypothetical protein